MDAIFSSENPVTFRTVTSSASTSLIVESASFIEDVKAFSPKPMVLQIAILRTVSPMVPLNTTVCFAPVSISRQKFFISADVSAVAVFACFMAFAVPVILTLAPPDDSLSLPSSVFRFRTAVAFFSMVFACDPPIFNWIVLFERLLTSFVSLSN